MAGCFFVLSLFRREIYGEASRIAVSPDGRYTASVTLDPMPQITLRNNQQGVPIPLTRTQETNVLMQKSRGFGWLEWEDNAVCSVLVHTGNTYADRIVWLKVSGNPPQAVVTSLESVDD